jgi:transposase InsO family protein
VYPFIEAEKAEDRNVAAACRCLEVSRAAYYQWSANTPCEHERKDIELLKRIKQIHDASRKTYGSPRVHAALRDEGVACGRKRVARLMRANGIVGRCPRRFTTTTIADHDALPTAVDLVKRIFGPGTIELDTLYAGDITYIRTWEGWLYLATVMDVASRRIVGWAMADHMRASLVCDALTMALEQRKPAEGLIFHSDRGCQYTSAEFAELLDDNGVRLSLSRPRQCWDNAVAESFFATLKTELVYLHAWPTRDRARRAIFEYIEVFYNRQRIHSALNYQSPANYERRRAQGGACHTEAA